MKSRYKIFNENSIFFVTSTIVNWIPVFVNEEYLKILLSTLKFYQTNNDLVIYAYVLMENHFHMLISNEKTSRVI